MRPVDLIIDVGGAILSSDGLEAPEPTSKIVGSVMIVRAESLAEVRKHVEADVYWTENVVCCLFCTICVPGDVFNDYLCVLSGIRSASSSSLSFRPLLLSIDQGNRKGLLTTMSSIHTFKQSLVRERNSLRTDPLVRFRSTRHWPAC